MIPAYQAHVLIFTVRPNSLFCCACSRDLMEHPGFYFYVYRPSQMFGSVTWRPKLKVDNLAVVQKGILKLF